VRSDRSTSSALDAGNEGGTPRAGRRGTPLVPTQAENGRPVPSGIAELPAVLRHECTSLQDVYRPPGVFLIADLAGQPVGCAGLSALPGGRTAEVRRLYVRPAHRGSGIARTLIGHATIMPPGTA
jgi:GNAT superfamily N-acetyltransferase